MSDALDFSDLTDAQIVELAGALASEALSRSPAVAAAFRDAMLTEKERAAAAVRGAQMGREGQRRQIEDMHRRAAQEQAREELRQQRQAALGVFLRNAAELVGREVHDVSLVWGAHYGPETRLYLNPGASVETVGALHLVEYTPGTAVIKTSWALADRKLPLLQWATETSAALRALGIDNINIKGLEL